MLNILLHLYQSHYLLHLFKLETFKAIIYMFINIFKVMFHLVRVVSMEDLVIKWIYLEV